MGIIIRHAYREDVDDLSRVEKACFPPTEAASYEAFQERVDAYGNHFYLMFMDEKLISFIDGFVTDEWDLTDEMFACAQMHNEHGSWQMLFGVNTLPEYRRRGYASELIRHMISDARVQGRKGLVLTAKEEKVPFYAKLGFVDEGITDKSNHGGVPWHQMRLTF